MSKASKEAAKDTEPALLVLWGNVKSNEIDENGLNDWWTNEHLPERLSIPGFTRARRYCARDATENKTSYLTLYDVENLSVLISNAYMDKLNNPTPGTRQHIPTLATMQRSACKIVSGQTRPELRSCSSTVGSSIVMITADLPDEETFRTWTASAVDYVSTIKKASEKYVVSVKVLQEVPEYTEPGSASQSYSNITLKRSSTGGVKIIVLIEWSIPTWLLNQLGGMVSLTDLTSTLQSQASERAEIHSMTYKLMCVVNE